MLSYKWVPFGIYLKRFTLRVDWNLLMYVNTTVKFRLTTGPIIRPSANYDHFVLVPNVPLYKSMVVGPNNATVQLLRTQVSLNEANLQLYSPPIYVTIWYLN